MYARAVDQVSNITIFPIFFFKFHSLNSRLTFRGVAGAYLYTVNVDGDAVAILEDRQKEVNAFNCQLYLHEGHFFQAIYIHNDIIKSGSLVNIAALRHPDFKEGNFSVPVQCTEKF